MAAETDVGKLRRQEGETEGVMGEGRWYQGNFVNDSDC